MTEHRGEKDDKEQKSKEKKKNKQPHTTQTKETQRMSRDSSAREALTTSSSAPRSSSSQGVDRSVRLHAIHVRIVGARSLSSNPVDALCMLWCGNQSEAVKTATKRRTADPVWEVRFISSSLFRVLFCVCVFVCVLFKCVCFVVRNCVKPARV